MTLNIPLVTDELDVLRQYANLEQARIVEAGCGAARLAQSIVDAYPGAQYTGLEVDCTQLQRNLQGAHPRMRFLEAGAQDTGLPSAAFDLALMLKSLHHVPLQAMDAALDEMARILVPGGLLYVSEPVYAGALNDIVRLYNDEGEVRAAAQAALDRALSRKDTCWTQKAVIRFDMPVHFTDFAQFEKRMMRPTFADHHLTDELVEQVGRAYAPHQTAEGAYFTRPMLVRVLCRK